MFKILSFIGVFGLLSLGVNYLWELIHSPYYRCIYREKEQRYCKYIIPATVGDMLFLYLIYFAGLLIWRDWFWFIDMHLWKGLFVLIMGTVLAVYIEWRAVSKQQRWKYKDGMITFSGN